MSRKPPTAYLAAMSPAELCAQHWATHANPPTNSKAARLLAKALREESHAELILRLGEQAAAAALQQYAEGHPPAPTSYEPPSSNSPPQRKRHIRRMYIEQKTDGPRQLAHKGPALLADVSTSKTGSTLYALGKTFQTLKGRGVYGNYRCLEDGNEYWISGIKKRGTNRHPFGKGPTTDP
jgi:hypothetical protein